LFDVSFSIYTVYVSDLASFAWFFDYLSIKAKNLSSDPSKTLFFAVDQSMKKSVHEAVDAHEIVSMSSGAFLCHQVHSATIDVKRALVEGWGHVGERPQRIVEKYELNTIYYDIRRILISEVESDLRTASDLSSEQPEGKSHSTPVFSSTSPHFQQKKVYIHPSISNGAF